MIGIKLSILSKEKEVNVFLQELKSILKSKNFNIEDELTIVKTKKKQGKEMFSTAYTLVDLEYDSFDVVKCLKELTVQEYSETLIDKDDITPPLLFVFGKDINNRQIYIKLKIKTAKTKYIVCVSFHYAEHRMSFPYA